jgi:hypothetical protein
VNEVERTIEAESEEFLGLRAELFAALEPDTGFLDRVESRIRARTLKRDSVSLFTDLFSIGLQTAKVVLVDEREAADEREIEQ